MEDKRLNDLAAGLEQKAEVFDELRMVIRIALPEGKSGLNDSGDEADCVIRSTSSTKSTELLPLNPLNFFH